MASVVSLSCKNENEPRKALKILKASIIQLPISQALLFLLVVSLSMGGWYTPGKLFQNLKEYLDKLKIMVADAHMWILALNFISSVLAIWALLVIIRVSQGHLDRFRHYQKFMVLEFVLIFAKVQNPTFEFLAKNELLPCKYPLSPLAFGNLLFDAVLLGEMIVLSVLARFLYKRDCPEMLSVPYCNDRFLESCAAAKPSGNHAQTQTSMSIYGFSTLNSLNSFIKLSVESAINNHPTMETYLSDCENVNVRVFRNNQPYSLVAEDLAACDSRCNQTPPPPQ